MVMNYNERKVVAAMEDLLGKAYGKDTASQLVFRKVSLGHVGDNAMDTWKELRSRDLIDLVAPAEQHAGAKEEHRRAEGTLPHGWEREFVPALWDDTKVGGDNRDDVVNRHMTNAARVVGGTRGDFSAFPRGFEGRKAYCVGLILAAFEEEERKAALDEGQQDDPANVIKFRGWDATRLSRP